jgi:hypothetical protein
MQPHDMIFNKAQGQVYGLVVKIPAVSPFMKTTLKLQISETHKVLFLFLKHKLTPIT